MNSILTALFSCILSYLLISSSFVIFVSNLNVQYCKTSLCISYTCYRILNLQERSFLCLLAILQTGTHCRVLYSVFLCKVVTRVKFFREAFYQTNFRKSRASKSTAPLGTESRWCTGYLRTINRRSLSDTSDHFCRWLCISVGKLSNERLDATDAKWQQFPSSVLLTLSSLCRQILKGGSWSSPKEKWRKS